MGVGHLRWAGPKVQGGLPKGAASETSALPLLPPLRQVPGPQAPHLAHCDDLGLGVELHGQGAALGQHLPRAQRDGLRVGTTVRWGGLKGLALGAGLGVYVR